DAAWTASQPSGVAVASKISSGWQLVAAEPSYQRFVARAHGLPFEARPTGSAPNAEQLLTAAVKLCGHSVDLIAIDMPPSTTSKRSAERSAAVLVHSRRPPRKRHRAAAQSRLWSLW